MEWKSAWQPVHKFLVTNRSQIVTIFRSAYLTVITLWIGAVILLVQDFEWWLTLSEVAAKAGTTSAVLYLTTLVPGLLKRFGVFPLVRASLMLFRRQIGVLMFLSAAFHQSIMSTVPMILFNGGIDLSLLSQHELYGSIGFWLLFPLWMTSNESSVKKLGKWWGRVHALTYAAMFFIYLHVATQSEKLRWAFMVIITLQVISWIYFAWQMARKRAVNAIPKS